MRHAAFLNPASRLAGVQRCGRIADKAQTAVRAPMGNQGPDLRFHGWS